jgi:hypothetical protein
LKRKLLCSMAISALAVLVLMGALTTNDVTATDPIAGPTAAAVAAELDSAAGGSDLGPVSILAVSDGSSNFIVPRTAAQTGDQPLATAAPAEWAASVLNAVGLHGLVNTFVAPREASTVPNIRRLTAWLDVTGVDGANHQSVTGTTPAEATSLIVLVTATCVWYAASRRGQSTRSAGCYRNTVRTANYRDSGVASGTDLDSVAGKGISFVGSIINFLTGSLEGDGGRIQRSVLRFGVVSA